MDYYYHILCGPWLKNPKFHLMDNIPGTSYLPRENHGRFLEKK